MPKKQQPRRCKACKRQTRHESHLCAKCRYDAEKPEVRYETATAKVDATVEIDLGK